MLTKTVFSSLSYPRLFSLGYALLISLSGYVHAENSDTLNPQEAVHIRTLAASCAACHGTQGNSHSITPVLAGLDVSYFSTQMIAFKKGVRASTVMHHHAQGLTTTEINQLAYYFSQQERISKSGPKPQKLRAAHE